MLDSQTQSAAAVQAWAAHLATVTSDLQSNNDAVAGFIDQQGVIVASDEARKLLRAAQAHPAGAAGQPGQRRRRSAIDYRDSHRAAAGAAAAGRRRGAGHFVANANTKQGYKGEYLSFNLNLNLPPACTTGFLPAQQAAIPNLVDYPDRAAGDLYCRIPQDSQFNVRGARNIPCETVPGKRAPTVKMCESNEQYVPLNDGYNWKGDPNATLSGQDIPQLPPGSPRSPALNMPTAPPRRL